MHEVVLQTLVSDVFWLLILVLVVGVFRREIKNLVNSLGSFKVAGASFQLRDSRSTMESYVLLTNVMVDALTQRDSALKVGDLISDLSVRQLAKFALRYAKDVPDDTTQIELLKNIALIVGKRGDADSALRFINGLLKSYPKDLDLLKIKSNTLGDTGAAEDLLEAERIQDLLVRTRPNDVVHYFNRAITKSRLGKQDEALDDLRSAIEGGYGSRHPEMLQMGVFKPLRELEPFHLLQEELKDRNKR